MGTRGRRALIDNGRFRPIAVIRNVRHHGRRLTGRGAITRRGILIAYKLVGPLAALCLFLGLLDGLDVIDISERGLPDALYTPFVMVMFGAVFLVPVLLILCPIIVFRFLGDRPVMLPALLLFIALLALFAPAFAGAARSFQWPGGVLFVAFIIAAIWAGYFAPKPSN